MSKDENNARHSLSFIQLLTLAFIILKLCGVIAWSWWWVWSPLWGTVIAIIIITVIIEIISTKTK